MNAVKFFITLAVLVACVMAAEQEKPREKRFPLAYSGLYHGGLGYGGYSAYGAYPYHAGYAGYAGYHHYSPVAYGAYGGLGAYHYPSYGYHGYHGYHYPSAYGHSLYHY